jgi:hypothetical protein
MHPSSLFAPLPYFLSSFERLTTGSAQRLVGKTAVVFLCSVCLSIPASSAHSIFQGCQTHSPTASRWRPNSSAPNTTRKDKPFRKPGIGTPEQLMQQQFWLQMPTQNSTCGSRLLKMRSFFGQTKTRCQMQKQRRSMNEWRRGSNSRQWWSFSVCTCCTCPTRSTGGNASRIQFWKYRRIKHSCATISRYNRHSARRSNAVASNKYFRPRLAQTSFASLVS